MKRSFICSAALLVLLSAEIPAGAQEPMSSPAPEGQLRSSAELDQMLGPIALYPDPLIGEILPAATIPSQIVLADRYVNAGGDPNLIDQQPWDASVVALAKFPALLKWMDDNLAWTTALGQAFLAQQQDVMDSIQRLRAQAQALGNLQSTPQESVVADEGAIEIVPADPQMIYVPVYQPDLVYFQRPFGGPLVAFGLGCAIGAWLHHDFDWHNHHLIAWSRNQPRPPGWWSQRPSERPRIEVNRATVWQPRGNPGLAVGNLDRGWDAHPARGAVTAVGRAPNPPSRAVPSEPRTVQHAPEPRRAPPANGALIGVGSSHQTQEFSNRGQQSRQATAPKPPAPSHSEAPSHPSGGGRR